MDLRDTDKSQHFVITACLFQSVIFRCDGKQNLRRICRICGCCSGILTNQKKGKNEMAIICTYFIDTEIYSQNVFVIMF